MKDERMLELLSRSLDEPLDRDEQQILANALTSSEELRSLARDLRLIRRVAKNQVPSCSPGVFQKLDLRVQTAFGPRRIGPAGRRWPIPALALAALLVLTLIGFWQLAPQAIDQTSFASAQEEVLAAQERFHTAVARMESLAMARLDQMPSELAHGYAHNLEVINAAIRDCERLVDSSPGNTVSYAALSHAYDAKVQLLQMILES